MNSSLISAEQLLMDPERGCEFDPFQAMRILELLANERTAHTENDWLEIESCARMRANVSMSFPPSLIAQVIPGLDGPADPEKIKSSALEVRRRYLRRKEPTLVLNFFGLFGPHGTLPILYTQALCELDRMGCLDSIRQQSTLSYRKSSTRTALRDWLDLFNHRFTTLLFRAWQKYRMTVGYQRVVWRDPKAGEGRPPDRVTQVLFSLAGLGVRPLKDRLGVWPPSGLGESPLVEVPDLGLLHYVAALARRRPGAHELAAMLSDYFQVPARVTELIGQWLALPASAQTRLKEGANASLGVNAVAGEQVWDTSSKFRIRIGPLKYREFIAFIPDPTPVPERKGAHLLSQITRLYVGPEFDFEIQLVLHRDEVPDCVLQEVPEGQLGIRLGWNTWLESDHRPEEVDDLRFDAVFDTILPRVAM